MPRGIFSALSISNKIAVVFLLLLVKVGVGGGVGLYSMGQVSLFTETLYKDSFQRAENLSTVEREFLFQRQELFLHIIITDESSKYFLKEAMAERRKKMARLLEEYRSPGLSGEQQGRVDDLGGLLKGYWAVQGEVVELSASGQRNPALELLGGKGTTSFHGAIDTLKAVIKDERAAAYEAYQKTEHSIRIFTYATLALTVLAILLAAGMWYILTRAIVRPILSIEDSARKMAGGDMSQRAPVVSGDEIGDLAEEFNRMAGSLEGYYTSLEGKVAERTDELGRANEELEAKKMELETKNEDLARASLMKSQFLANVSHELRTPLNSIIGFSELLQEKAFGKLSEKQGQYVNFIHSSGGHLLQLINNILDLSKIEVGRMELSHEEFPLSEILGEIMGTVRPIAHKKHITLDAREAHASPLIRADRGKFKQILLNLLSNAVKFNVEGGSVVVDWDMVEEPRGMEMKRFLVLSVRDTGIGIKEEDLKRVFLEFEQLDSSITREYGGTGLGLALTKKLVELHGGEIRAESDEGAGSVFTVKLPQEFERVAAPVLTGQAPVEAEEKREERPRILVAAESSDINRLIEVYLSSEWYDIVICPDGADLIKKAGEKRKKPFAAVIGITIPRKDGWEVLKEMKADPELADIPVIIVSATDNRELGLSLGAADYLIKPVSKKKLLRALERLSYTKSLGRSVFNILVVDDEPQILKILDDLLREEGFGVIKAKDGQEAVRLAVEKVPDIMILDLMMPGMSGFDVINKLKDHPEAGDIPIIISTAREITNEDIKLLGGNVKKILQKADFSRGKLLSEIRLLEMAYPERSDLVDRTTKLPNKRYFEGAFSREMSKATDDGYVFSVSLVAIDDFSAFTGSGALREIGALFKENLRGGDFVAKYDDDELAMLLPGVTGEQAHKVAEKLRGIIESHSFAGGGVEGKGLTVSIAVASLPADGSLDVLKELEAAIRDMRSSGGNRVSPIRGLDNG